MKIIVSIFKWIRKNILYILGYGASFYIAIYLISKCQEEREQEHFREIARQEKMTKKLQEEEKKRILEEEQRKQKEEQRKQEEERRLKEEREIQSGKIDGHAFVDLGLPSGTLWHPKKKLVSILPGERPRGILMSQKDVSLKMSIFIMMRPMID